MHDEETAKHGHDKKQKKKKSNFCHRKRSSWSNKKEGAPMFMIYDDPYNDDVVVVYLPLDCGTNITYGTIGVCNVCTVCVRETGCVVVAMMTSWKSIFRDRPRFLGDLLTNSASPHDTKLCLEQLFRHVKTTEQRPLICSSSCSLVVSCPCP